MMKSLILDSWRLRISQSAFVESLGPKKYVWGEPQREVQSRTTDESWERMKEGRLSYFVGSISKKADAIESSTFTSSRAKDKASCYQRYQTTL